MVTALDDSLKELETIYKAHGLWEDTILVFASDNGGYNQKAHGHSGNNYPLRGFKTSIFEGGIRTPAFIRGTDSDLAPLPSGAESTQLFSATDWLVTLGGLAGIPVTSNQPLDGVDQSQMLRSGGAVSDRDTIVHNAHHSLAKGGIRVGDYKLLVENSEMRVKAPNAKVVNWMGKLGKQVKSYKRKCTLMMAWRSILAAPRALSELSK